MLIKVHSKSWETNVVVGCVRCRSGSSRDIAYDSENITACVKFCHCGPCLCWQVTNREETWLRSAAWVNEGSVLKKKTTLLMIASWDIPIKIVLWHQLLFHSRYSQSLSCLAKYYVRMFASCRCLFAKLALSFPLIGESCGILTSDIQCLHKSVLKQFKCRQMWVARVGSMMQLPSQLTAKSKAAKMFWRFKHIYH